MPRYCFGEFVLSPRRRLLLRNGREQPLIPRYFDLLVFLIERRGDAVHRREIFDRVWSDVVVSDGALSQACGVSEPANVRHAYAGPCQSGWVQSAYVKLIAGDEGPPPVANEAAPAPAEG